jgi:hypothetical protein
MLIVARTQHKHAIISGGIAFLGIAVGMAWLHAVSGGWSTFYLYILPSYHEFQNQFYLGFWSQGIFMRQCIPFLFFLFLLYQIRQKSNTKFLEQASLIVGFLLCSYVMRLNSWSAMNVYMPAYAILSLAAGLSLRYFETLSLSAAKWWPGLLVMHFFTLYYNPIPLVPTQESIETGNRFVKLIESIPGDVLLPEIQFLPKKVGKKSYALGAAAKDIFRTDLGEYDHIKADLVREIVKATREQQFSAMAPDQFVPIKERNKYYRKQILLKMPIASPYGITNFLPKDIYVPITTTEQPYIYDLETDLYTTVPSEQPQ